MNTRLLYRLGFLFMVFGTVTDGNLAAEELGAMADRLKRWIRPHHRVSLVDVVEEAGRVYDMHENDADIRRTAYRYAALLGRSLPLRTRREIVDDLVAIAKADGVIHESEIRFLNMVMGAFGMKERNPLVSDPSSSSSGLRVQ